MSLYKRPGSKYWWMKFVFDGRLIQQSTKCKNKRDAETVESAYRTQLALGKVGIKPRRKAASFKQAAEEYLAWQKLNHATKPKSYTRITYSVQPLIDYFNTTPVDKIEKKHIEAFILHRSKQTSRKTGKPITADTINLELGACKMIFKRQVAEGVLFTSPATEIEQLPKNDRRFYVLSREEESRYLMACKQPLRDVATLMLDTGARPDEIYQMRREQVNLDQGYWQVVGGKTETSNRKIWLNDRAAGVLRHRLEKYEGEHLFPKGNQDFEVPTYPLNDQHYTARDRAKLPKHFRIYDCRHTFATRAVESGVDLLTLAHILGHSNLDEVMRYAHPSEGHKREAVQMMSKGKVKAA